VIRKGGRFREYSCATVHRVDARVDNTSAARITNLLFIMTASYIRIRSTSSEFISLQRASAESANSVTIHNSKMVSFPKPRRALMRVLSVIGPRKNKSQRRPRPFETPGTRRVERDPTKRLCERSKRIESGTCRQRRSKSTGLASATGEQHRVCDNSHFSSPSR
jgi:hypothetical protein